MGQPLAILLHSLALLSGAAAAASGCVDHPFGIDRVVDGDTVVLATPPGLLPSPLGPLALRVRGVDCPESGHRARCPEEAAMATEAAAFTASVVAHSRGVEVCGWDKYGGRVLGDVWLADDGRRRQRLSERLIAAGHAVAYAGRGPRRDWCACTAPEAPEAPEAPSSRQRADGDGDGGDGAEG